MSDRNAQRALEAEVRRALMAEIGARSIYARLAKRTRDTELRSVLASLHDEEIALVEEARALLFAAGARRAPNRSLARACAGWMLAACSRGRAGSIAVRLCHDSECTVARWYHDLSIRFASSGDVERARACDRLAQQKQRHARVLEAWIPR